MNRYDRYRACPKCGQTGSVDEHQCAYPGYLPERIQRKCCNCGYEWDELPRDAPLQPGEEKVRKPENIMLKLDGTLFRCHCGCNVFQRPREDRCIYRCNSCNTEYIGKE